MWLPLMLSSPAQPLSRVSWCLQLSCSGPCSSQLNPLPPPWEFTFPHRKYSKRGLYLRGCLSPAENLELIDQRSLGFIVGASLKFGDKVRKLHLPKRKQVRFNVDWMKSDLNEEEGIRLGVGWPRLILISPISLQTSMNSLELSESFFSSVKWG